MSPLTAVQHKKHADVLWAGRQAYKMIIPVSGNPHSKQPFRDLWDKGWRLERRRDESAQNPRPLRAPRAVPDPAQRPSFSRRPGQQLVAARLPRRPLPNSSVPHTAANHVINAAPQSPQPAVTDRLVSRFNRRHQTQV